MSLTMGLNMTAGSADMALLSAMMEQYQQQMNSQDSTMLADTLNGKQVSLAQFANDADVMFVLVSGYLVFFMQAGFAMVRCWVLATHLSDCGGAIRIFLLSVGAVRTKNVKNILLYIMMDATVGSIGWYLLGYGFAFGDRLDADGHSIGNGFIGSKQFAFKDLPRGTFYNWFFQYTFAATSATIVSGAVIERAKISAYIGYSLFLTAFVYPVVAHWQWSASGWLSPFRQPTVGPKLFGSGMIDFAGCGAVHMVGGVSGIVGAYIVGPRIGRYNPDGTSNPQPGHNVSLLALGTLMLWFGWYGFNGGSAGSIVGMSDTVSRVAVSTTLGGAAGGLSCLMFAVLWDGCWDVTMALNGSLAGLVSITSGCAFFEPWAAIVAGGVGGIVFPLVSRLLTRLRVDDPLEAGAMHGGCGAWGLLATGFLAEITSIQSYYGPQAIPGAFYRRGQMLACQICGIVTIGGWVASMMCFCFMALKKLKMLRITAEEEAMGMDASHHGGSAYPEQDISYSYTMNGKDGRGPGPAQKMETGFTNFDGHVVDFGVSSGANSPNATRAENLQETSQDNKDKKDKKETEKKAATKV